MMPPPHPDPLLEAKHARHPLTDSSGIFTIGIAGVITLLVVVAIVLRFI